MSEQNSGKPEDSNEGKPTDEKPEEGSESTDEKPEGQEPEGEEGGSTLTPEELAKELTRVRAEAANYRVKLREAETKLSEAKTPEDIEAAVAEIREENAKLNRAVLVSQVARKHELPTEQEQILSALAEAGKSEQELDAYAKTLALAVAPLDPAHLEGGLTPGDEDDEPSDPRALARKYGRGRKSA